MMELRFLLWIQDRISGSLNYGERYITRYRCWKYEHRFRGILQWGRRTKVSQTDSYSETEPRMN